jgi:predicted permease
MIHGDLSSFLYGTGLIGLIWYVLIFLSLGSSNFLFYKLFFRNRTERVMIAVAFALLTSGFIITITGTGTIGERAIMYLTLGAIFGYLRNSYKEKLDTPVKT